MKLRLLKPALLAATAVAVLFAGQAAAARPSQDAPAQDAVESGDTPDQGPGLVKLGDTPGQGAVEPEEKPCREFDDSGKELAYGEFSDRAVVMGDDLSLIWEEHSSTVAGVAYCSDRAGLAVYLKPGASEVERLFKDVGAKYPELSLHIEYVPRSYDELQDLVSQVVAAGFEELGLAGIGPDVYTGGLLLAVQGYGDRADLAPDQAIADAEAAVRAVVGNDVPLTSSLEKSELIDAYSR
jgi:hypothetical protein